MFAAVIKQLVLIFSVVFWLTTAAQADSTEPDLSLSGLTKAAIELQANLLFAEERLFQRNPDTLTLFINSDNLPARLLNELDISLDNKTVVQHLFTASESEALNNGAMKKIYSAPVEPGTHTIRVVVNGSTTNREKSSTTYTMEKGRGHDTLKITVANPLQKRTPDLFFEQQLGITP